MSLISVEEKIELLKNLLADPDDWISAELLRLNEKSEEANRDAENNLLLAKDASKQFASNKLFDPS